MIRKKINSQTVYILCLLLNLSFYHKCYAQPNTAHILNTTEMEIPVITKEFEKFTYEGLSLKKGLNTVITKDGDYQEYDTQSYGFISRVYPKNSCFKIIKKYYKNTFIKEKGLMFNYGSAKIGIWYYYDEQGKLIKEENTDQEYTFSYGDLLKYLAAQKIPVAMGYNNFGFNTLIIKQTGKKGVYWKIEWLKDFSKNPNVIEKIILNGKSGKVLKKTESELRRG